MKYLAIFLIICALLITPTVYGWELAKNDILQRSPTRAYYQFRKTFSKVTRKVTMDLYLFDTRRCRLRVLDQGSPKQTRKYRNLGEAMTKENCLAGVNGSYFNQSFFPLGTVIDSGRQIRGPGKSRLLTGTVVTDGNQAQMLWKGEQTTLRGLDVLQAGPRLVTGKVPIAGLSDKKQRRRTFVLTNGRGWWGIGVCRTVSLKELAEMLADRRLIPEIDVWRALNLDGGSSSAMWVRGNTGQASTYVREWSTVRNYLGVQALPK